jgi:hypothetical protein
MEIGWWKDKSQKITGDAEENQNWKLGFKKFWKSKSAHQEMRIANFYYVNGETF